MEETLHGTIYAWKLLAESLPRNLGVTREWYTPAE